MSEDPQTTSRFVRTNGVNLQVVQTGSEECPLVITLHGFPEFWYGWRNQIRPLAEGGMWVWAPDQRGYNLSDKPAGVSAYHIDLLARDILGLIEEAGRQRASLVGHDWGAAVAWHMATYYPQHVDRLVIMNVPHLSVMAQTLKRSSSQLRKSWYIFFFQIPWLPEQILGWNRAQGLSSMFVRSGKPGSFSNEDLRRYKEAWSQPGALSAMLNWYRSAVRSNLKTLFTTPSLPPRIQAPTLVIWGKQDIALSHDMAQPSVDLCSDGRLVFFEEASHWVQHDEADKVNALLLDFLR
ncbi:MAG: alpha/beta hydrolase [Anaerolineales bacterium]